MSEPATAPAEGAPPETRKSRVDKFECLFCGRANTVHVRRGVWVRCKYCKRENPGADMREALAARPAAVSPAKARARAKAAAPPEPGKKRAPRIGIAGDGGKGAAVSTPSAVPSPSPPASNGADHSAPDDAPVPKGPGFLDRLMYG